MPVVRETGFRSKLGTEMRQITCAVLVIAAGLTARGQEWRQSSPRPEVAPKYSRTGAELTLEGAGNPGVFGGWEQVLPSIQAGQWYRLTGQYRAAGLGYEPLQVPVKLDWQNAQGHRAGQPDYAWRVEGSGEWRTVSLEAPAPEGAVSARLQLLLQNAPQGRVSWKDWKLEPIAAPKARPVRVAAIRLRPRGADPVTRFMEVSEAKVPQGTDVILLPEGITVVGTNKGYAEVAEPVPGPTTKRLGELAKQKGAWVVAGLYEKEGALVYNTAVLIDRAGRYIGRYRKVYIPREELEGGITPGSEFPVFQADFGKVGMMICWDVQYADPARGLALRGAELILMPIWGGNETLAKARAIENHLFLASSGYDFPSLIIDPAGETLARSEDDGTVALSTIDLNRRYLDPWLGDMKARFFRELRGDVTVDPVGRR